MRETIWYLERCWFHKGGGGGGITMRCWYAAGAVSMRFTVGSFFDKKPRDLSSPYPLTMEIKI